jgi:branched-chain amino acid transport system substrate-binding protein
MRQARRSWLRLAMTVALTLSACQGGPDGGGGDDQGGGGAEPLIIGYAAALSGEGALGDVNGLVGVEYAVNKLNEAGGIDGHEVQLITKDMKSEPELGGTVTQELIDQGAGVILGPPFPGMAVGVIQTAAQAGVPVLSVTSTQPEFPVVGGTKAYLVAFGDNVQAAAVAEYALEQGFRTAFTVDSPDLSYTSENPRFFVDTFEQGGGESLGSVTYSLGQEDFSTQVTEIASLDPQPNVIFTAMFMPDLGPFVRQLRAAGVEAPVYGVDGFDDQGFLDFAGEDAEGTAFATHGFPTPGSKFETFLQETEEQPDAPALAALGVDTVDVIAAAVREAGSVEPEAIGNALARLQDVEVTTGTITYAGTNGIPVKTVTIAGVENGEFVFKNQFVPSYIPEP